MDIFIYLKCPRHGLFSHLKPRDATLLQDSFFLKSRPIHVYNTR